MPGIGNWPLNDMAGNVHGAGDSGGCRFITESSGRTGVHTGLKTWNRSAENVTILSIELNEASEQQRMNDKTLIRDMAALLCEVYHFARDRAGRLFVYKDGVYVHGAEFFLRQQVKRLLLLFDKSERWSSGLARELIEYILLDA